MRAHVLLALLTLASASRARRGPADSSIKVERIESQVVASKAFQEKLTERCGMDSMCKSTAAHSLFCTMLERKKPELAQAHCGGAAPGSKVAKVKAQVTSSKSFNKTTQQLSSKLGCNSVPKAEACSSYVKDAAFCLLFADKMESFRNATGVEAEKRLCKRIDAKKPRLSTSGQRRPHTMFGQVSARLERRASEPSDDLAKEMTHDLEMNFNKIAPFGKEDTAKELQDHAAKTQDTLVDAVENAEVAEIKRAVFRALTRLRAATIKEFDTIARLETQAIDAYNDAHHYRGENPLAHLHEDEAPVETDKLKSFH